MKIDIFDYLDYKEFVNDFIRLLPMNGRGQYARIAEAAQTHRVTVSQIFRGDKHLGSEQAARVARHLGLRPTQSRYFITLVDFSRAGSADLRDHYLSLLQSMRDSNQELSQRLGKKATLTDEDRAIFYSNWIYSAVRLISSIPGANTCESIAKRFHLPRETVERIIEFLLKTGLCVETAPGSIYPGPKSTYIESTSPLVARHHGNWRVKAMERHPTLNAKEELSYTSPVTLSSKDVRRIREILVRAIESTDEVVGPSDCERFFCLNVDWFEVK